ncbi:MAG: glutamine--tRNA ligase/YqeY domain fusion protein, partial [Gammaproteobacteria bacterium]|nr:glutamine--tRNA ligase/YqeY domain fusion protein [Gammaproteobacteria bacterium]
MNSRETPRSRDFIRQRIDQDLAAGKNGGRVVTRFPPEPNGYLHIGHAKSACLNFGIAKEYPGGACTLRFDDTNPTKESEEYIESIKEDVAWLGFDWGDRLRHASDYFEQLYEFALTLVRKGKAYVDSLSIEQIREYRGTLTEPGRESPHRNRSVEENLDLFERMRAGEFPNGAHVLRANIDMAAGNLNLRDPVMYRILHVPHPMTGDKWCIYPTYDFTHGQSDYIEGVTHSLCTLEFEDHRPLYDWYLEQIEAEPRPIQIEFSRLNLSYTVMSKRLLVKLVEDRHVSGWSDPRMPTLKGLRRRGYTPASIRDFCARIGVTRKDNLIELGVLENCLREELDAVAPRVMAVLRPLKIMIDNYPEDETEQLEAANHPKDPSLGSRMLPFSRTLYIERDDFMEAPPKKFFRLAPGREVRLRYAYLVTCVSVVHDDNGEVAEVHCVYDPESRGGNAPDGRKVRGTIHWVCAQSAVDAEVRLYDRLFSVSNP